MIDLFDLLGYVLLLSIVGPATLLVLLKLQGKKMPSLLGRSGGKKIESRPAEDDDLALPSERRRSRERSRDRGRREREPAKPAGPVEEAPTEPIPPLSEPLAMPRRGAPIVEAPEPAPEARASSPEPRPAPEESPAEAPRSTQAPEEGRAAAISERLANMTPEERLKRREERRARRAARSD